MICGGVWRPRNDPGDHFSHTRAEPRPQTIRGIVSRVYGRSPNLPAQIPPSPYLAPSARTEGRKQSTRPVGAVRALHSQRLWMIGSPANGLQAIKVLCRAIN